MRLKPWSQELSGVSSGARVRYSSRHQENRGSKSNEERIGGAERPTSFLLLFGTKEKGSYYHAD